MKYLVLLMSYGEMPLWEELTPAEQEEGMAKHYAFADACREREGVEILGGEALGPSEAATVMRTRGGEVSLTDGPYAEAVEQLGGFYLVEAPSLDVLVEVLQVLPAYDMQIAPVIDV